MRLNLLALFCLSTGFGLEASHFHSAISVTPMNETDYFAEIQIEKIFDEKESEIIATPTLMCVKGERAELIVESEDHRDLLSIQLLVPEDVENIGFQYSILMKKNNQVVLSFTS